MKRRGAFTAVILASLAGAWAATAAAGDAMGSNLQVITEGGNPQPGAPVDVLANYQAFESLAEANPTLWGGAYVDGDALVIKFAGQSEAEAVARLARAGVTRGIRLVGSSTTMADLDAAQAAADAALRRDPNAVSWGPDFATSALTVTTTTADDGTLARLRSLVPPAIPVHVTEDDHRALLASR